jgi:hypothetical protein
MIQWYCDHSYCYHLLNRITLAQTRGSKPGGRVLLGGLERSQTSEHLGTFVTVGRVKA